MAKHRLHDGRPGENRPDADRRANRPGDGRIRDNPRAGGVGLRLAPAALVPVVLWLAVCDSMAPNRPPEVVGAASVRIEADLLDPPTTLSENAAARFSDPDGDPLTLSVRSSNPEAVTASLSEGILTIAAIAVGDAAVIVIATDPGGLYAAWSVQVSVRLPNRPPLAIGTIPPASVVEDAPLELDVVWHFRDPDGDPLAYSAAASDTGIVEIATTGSLITLAAIATGATTLTLTATDPDGLSASHEIAVRAEAGAPGFRDDFDDADHPGWELGNADAQVADGVLRWTNVAAGQPGRLVRGATRTLADWQAKLRIGRVQENAVVRLVVHTEDRIMPSLGAEIGSGVALGGRDTNARLVGLIDLGGTPTWASLAASEWETLDDGAGEFAEITVAMRDRRLSLEAGRWTVAMDLGTVLGAPPEVGVFTGLELWIVPLDSTATERGGLVDWIEVGGALAGDSPEASRATWTMSAQVEPWRPSAHARREGR